MVDVCIIGGGPAGLSAGLFTAKNGLETVVFDADETWMHKAHLFNYLGIRSIGGSEFMTLARGQVRDRGATVHTDTSVEAVSRTTGGFEVEAGEETVEATYVILATGATRDLAADAGCTIEDDLVAVDLSMETSIPNLYATGAMVRDQEWQAIISAGDGAAAALHILSKERGEHFHDFDTPADVPDVSD